MIFSHAFSFTTGTTNLTLTGITLGTPYSTESVTNLSLSLYWNNAGVPGGAPIGSFSPGQFAGQIADNSTYATSYYTYTFTPAAETLALDASTAYWLVAALSSSGQFRMPSTASDDSTGLPGWSIGDVYLSRESGGEWQSGGEALQFSVSAVPEPSTYAALAGLGALGLAIWIRRRS